MEKMSIDKRYAAAAAYLPPHFDSLQYAVENTSLVLNKILYRLEYAPICMITPSPFNECRLFQSAKRLNAHQPKHFIFQYVIGF